MYNRVKPGLYGFILKLVKNKEVADDLFANTMIKLYTKIDQYNLDFAITTWLYRIARNECYAYFNEQKKTVSIEPMLDKGYAPHENSDGHITINASEDISNEAFVEITDEEYLEEEQKIINKYNDVIEAIHGLKPLYRAIMIDRMINNMKYKDIANKHNMTLQTVKNRIRRGKYLIKKELE